MKKLYLPFVSLLLLSLAAPAQNSSAMAARAWRQAHERAVVSELMQFVNLPNLPTEPANLRKNAEAVQKILERSGVKTRLLEAPGGPPLVYGELLTPGATRTLVYYAHYDGQPLDPKEWATPPFQATLRDGPLDKNSKVISLPAEGQPIGPEWYIYGRSSGDDKVTIVAFAAALQALREKGISLKQNIKFAIEGEEEVDSPHLQQIIAANKELLKADAWLIGDSPSHPSRRPLLIFGVRGIQKVDITVYGARRELHSGHYGNWAPNPAMMLAQLLASMKDADGRVVIDKFYDGVEPLSPAEKAAIASAPNVDETLKRELWLGRTEQPGKSLLELINQPSLNIRGMGSARIGGGASNVVPSTATATIDIRLVKGTDGKVMAQRLTDHVRKQGYFVVDKDPDQQTLLSHPRVAKVVPGGGYNALRTSMDLPISKKIMETIDSVRGPAIKLPSMGGSVPLFMIQEELASPTILIPIANHDDNQHAANENIRIQNLWDGIETYAALFSMQ